MFKYFKELKTKSKRAAINEFIEEQKLLDKQISLRSEFAGINKIMIPYHFKKDIVLLPAGRIHCIGNNSEIAIDTASNNYHFDKEAMDHGDTHITIKSGQVVIVENKRSKGVSVWYAV